MEEAGSWEIIGEFFYITKKVFFNKKFNAHLSEFLQKKDSHLWYSHSLNPKSPAELSLFKYHYVSFSYELLLKPKKVRRVSNFNKLRSKFG
ncbi:hypothetical protein A0128_18280 [Leptospira tipperaryensis]|uniref:Uncharacterized protein n=1 Tax=Leptospira tipperaryensis TaxID=2564040 RepID=A0A1D7V1A4_9LEPT|nr:hypothetical protein A0128_18280 [Leptospira tipperaryensis]